ncbi:MAG: winged helix-turn-helix transcriptional regulator [Saprospiraceae bacterium]|nr:winged helix-turn-helix transcriptional regulator [Saprospiraceae bacterium]
MGITKTDLYTKEQNTLASFAKVLGHPARIAILQHLLKIKACICGDLVDEIGLAQATISQHLKELKKISIIKGDIEGNTICYCINEEKWNEIKDILMAFFEMRSDENSCC